MHQGFRVAFVVFAIHGYELFGGPIWEAFEDHFLAAVFGFIGETAQGLPAGGCRDVLPEDDRFFAFLETHALVDAVVDRAKFYMLPAVATGDEFCLILVLG